jgi:hypothetical protein
MDGMSQGKFPSGLSPSDSLRESEALGPSNEDDDRKEKRKRFGAIKSHAGSFSFKNAPLDPDEVHSKNRMKPHFEEWTRFREFLDLSLSKGSGRKKGVKQIVAPITVDVTEWKDVKPKEHKLHLIAYFATDLKKKYPKLPSESVISTKIELALQLKCIVPGSIVLRDGRIKRIKGLEIVSSSTGKDLSFPPMKPPKKAAKKKDSKDLLKIHLEKMIKENGARLSKIVS